MFYFREVITEEIVKYNLPNDEGCVPDHQNFRFDANNPFYFKNKDVSPFYNYAGLDDFASPMIKEEFDEMLSEFILNHQNISKQFIMDNLAKLGLFNVIVHYKGLTIEEKRKILYENLDKAFIYSWDTNYNIDALFYEELVHSNEKTYREESILRKKDYEFFVEKFGDKFKSNIDEHTIQRIERS